ncbi:MAG: suhb [Epsilonproteobacteria bacterium]|nr:suhb [Campylobacterota bacterium]
MKFLKLCKKASKDIIKLLNSNHKSLFKKTNKGFGGDTSMNIDLLAEKIFIEYFKDYGNIFSEECGVVDYGFDNTFIIDPIDGSFNISNGFPYYGSSVALRGKDGEIKKAFIINLATGDYFYKDSKTKIENNLFYQKHSTYSLHEMILFEKAYANVCLCNKLARHNIKYRSPGALALSLALAHKTKAVIFRGEIREFDIAAGIFFNNDLHIKIKDNTLLVAKNKKDFKYLKDIIFD